MCYKAKFSFLFLLFWLISYLSYSQEIKSYKLQDSLSDMTYGELINGFYNSLNDSLKLKAYANTYLRKAKKEKSKKNVAKGYHLFVYINNGKEQVLDYCDSLLYETNNFENSKYHTLAYLEKGNYYFKVKNFRSALDSYIKANNIAKSYKGKLRFKSMVDHNIGLIKSKLGRNKEALEIFKKNWEEIKEYNSDTYNRLESIYSLSDSYMKNQKYDSSSYYNRLGINESLAHQLPLQYNKFVLNEGIVIYKQGFFSKSLDSLIKTLAFFEKNKLDNELIELYYYLGKNYKDQNQISKSIFYFKKVDSIFSTSKDIIPEAREIYEILIKYYKSINDSKNQLLYIERLLKADSLLHNNYKYLNNQIIYSYDTPKLIFEKQIIIEKLKLEKNSYYFGLLLLSLMVIILCLAFLKHRKKQKIYLDRFQNLDSEKEILKTESNDINNSSKDIGISDEVINDVLKKLQKFVDNEQYLSNNVTMQDLSKSIGTNARYLSKIINTYEKKNFSNYLNDLRIIYIVKKLRENKKYRNYTIKAIALEIGFNNTQSFSNAFYKKTGIYPSYFIKQLNKKI